MSGRRSERRGYEKLNYELHVGRVKDAKGTVDCQPPRPHPLVNRGDLDQVSTICNMHYSLIQVTLSKTHQIYPDITNLSLTIT